MADYRNVVPEEYDGPRCQFQPEAGWEEMQCGLPVWPDAPETQAGEPRCEFHSRSNPADIRERLEDALGREAVLMEAKLSGASLEGVCLSGAILLEGDFRGANLLEADLVGSDLAGANLAGASLLAAHLTGAIMPLSMLSGADLLCAELSGVNLYRADLSGADMRDCALEGWWRLTPFAGEPGQLVGRETPPNLQKADLRGALLTGITIASEAQLDGALFGPGGGACCHTVRDEVVAESDAAWRSLQDEHGEQGWERPTFGDCARVYRQLKLCFQESGSYREAGEWYFSEMRCVRRQEAKDGGPWLERVGMFVMEKVAGYGEREWRPLIAVFVLAVIAALAQGWIGIRDMHGDYVMRGIDWVPSWEGVGRFFTALYFSVVTLTTLGYGDLQPAPVWGRLVAGTEAILGFVLLSLFLVCVVRKFSR